MLPVQASGLVPIVEPEVLLDGEHDIDRTLEVAEAIWAETFKYMADQKVRACVAHAALLLPKGCGAGLCLLLKRGMPDGSPKAPSMTCGNGGGSWA